MSSLILALGMVSDIDVIVNIVYLLYIPEKINYLYLFFIVAHKFKPKIKPRPRVGKTSANTSASSSVMMEKSGELPNCINDIPSFLSIVDGSGGLNSTSLPLPTSGILRTTNLS